MTGTARGRRLVPLFFLVLVALPVRGAPLDAAAVEALLQQARDTWHAPGLAAVIVREGEVVYLGGSGVRQQGRDGPVGPDTLFGIGSLTKAFTATVLAQLIDEQRAAWDDPVRKHLIWFHLADPLADRDVTLRDLLSHRTGLARNDLLWKQAPWTIEETVRRLRYLEPVHSFRSRYEYNNLAYLTAGLVLESLERRPWNEVMRRRLLEPLDMTSAVFSRSEVEKSADHASPHHRRPDGKVEVIPWYNDDGRLRASGSLKLSARSLGRWLRFQLARGQYAGRQVVSVRNFEETHRAQVVVPLDAELTRHTEAIQDSYGLGWHLTDYRSHPLHEHGGSVDGFRAHIWLLPRDQVGVVVLANVDEAGVVEAAGYLLLDHLLGLSARDWHAIFLARSREQLRKQQESHDRLLASRRPGTRPSRELSAYAGKYSEPAYGTVQVELEADQLHLRWSSFRAPLQHFHYDTFLPQAAPLDHPFHDQPATFELDEDGQVSVLRFLGRKLTRRTPANE